MTYPQRAMYVALAVCTVGWLIVTPARAQSGTGGGATPQGAGGATGKVAPTRGVAPADIEVLRTLHASNQVAMKVGKTAKDRTILDAAKSFAIKVMGDHAREDKKIVVFLKKRGLRMSALGAVNTDVPPEHNAYKTKTGSAYDHAFASQMAADYQKSIALVERARKETADETLRALLDELLPTLQVLEASAKVLSDSHP